MVEDHSKKTPPEDEDKALHEIDELTQRWQDRLTIDNLAFAERYLKMEMGLGIEVAFKESRSKKFVAFFERKRSISAVVTPDRWEAYFSQVGPYRDDRSVFVDFVQLIQTPDGFTPASTVRLQPSHKFFNIRAGVVEEETGSVAIQVPLLPTYWEVDFLLFFVGNAAASTDESDGKCVQCRPSVVYHIADNAAPPGIDWLDYVDLVDFYSRLRIFIDDRCVRLSLHESRDLRIEFSKVFFGPVKLYPTT